MDDTVVIVLFAFCIVVTILCAVAGIAYVVYNIVMSFEKIHHPKNPKRKFHERKKRFPNR